MAAGKRLSWPQSIQRKGAVMQSLKARMRAGEVVNGFWVELFSPGAAEVMSAAGYDCAMIDLEHGAADLSDAVAVMRALHSGCAPLVRVPANDAAWVKRVLDAGAAGVMVPAVSSAEEAAAAVAACHYAPRGIRGMAAPIVRAAGYGADWRGYVEDIERSVLAICQVETRAAVENVADIAAVEGLDMIFLGPFDLSGSLGHLGEPDHPHVREAIAAVEAAAKAAGCLLGGIPTPGRTARDLYRAGYHLVLGEIDVALLRDGARAGVAALREAAKGP
jgi:4-hydroxy-2-oxoheptanedioate aldolase